MIRLEAAMHGTEDAVRAATFCRTHDIQHLHAVHSARGEDPAAIVSALRKEYPALSVTAYLCAKHTIDRSVENGRTAFLSLFNSVKKVGTKSFVITSGYPRADFDAVEALRAFPAHQVMDAVSISCAYNPYFDPARLREEQERLRAKLSFPLVNGIVFQIGMDIEKLKKGVEAVRAIRSDVQLFGMVPAPVASTITHLREEAPFGIFLPNSYLLREEMAKEMTDSLLHVFHEQGIEPVIYAWELDDIVPVLPLFE